MNTIDAVSHLLENCLHFRVETNLNDAKEILKKFRHYNDVPSNISEIVDDVKKNIGPINFQTVNANNGRFDNIRFEIGNENSFVIYIRSNMFYRKFERPELHKSTLESIGEKYQANEISCDIVTNPHFPEMISVECRLWWD